jgi:hypothetical protein
VPEGGPNPAQLFRRVAAIHVARQALVCPHPPGRDQQFPGNRRDGAPFAKPGRPCVKLRRPGPLVRWTAPPGRLAQEVAEERGTVPADGAAPIRFARLMGRRVEPGLARDPTGRPKALRVAPGCPENDGDPRADPR